MDEKVLQSIESLEIEARTKESIIHTLEKSKEILSKLKQKFGENSSRYIKAKKEYDDIRKGIKESLKNDKKITREELVLIELEFINLLRLKFGDNAVASFLDKKGRIARSFGASSSRIDSLRDSTEITNQYQESLIRKVLGKDYEKGYNDKYLMGYSNDTGNFLIKIDDFEKQITQNGIKDINLLALANYFSYLESRGELNINTLLDRMGSDNVYDLINILSNSKNRHLSSVEQRLKRMKLSKDLMGVIEILSGTDKFLSGVHELSREQKYLTLKFLDKNVSSTKEKFEKDLFERFKRANPNMKESEINKIINEMFGKLFRYKGLDGLPEIYKVFYENNRKYKLGLIVSRETKKLIEIHRKQNYLTIIEIENEIEKAKRDGNEARVDEIKKKQEEQEKQIRQIDAISEVVSKTNDDKIKQIVLQKISFQDHVNNLRKKDKSFDKTMMILEKEKQNHKKNNKNSQNKKENSKQTNSKENQTLKQKITLFYPDGTRLNCFQVSSVGGYLVETRKGNIEISPQEFDIVKKNKNALDNIIKFKEVLDELNLLGLFKYREGIFKAISNKDVLAFSVDDDYLNENELIIFIQAVLRSIGYKLDNVTSLESLKSEVKNINKVGFIGGIRDVSVHGDSYIEKEFIERFDPKRTSILNQNAFEESLQKINFKIKEF